jgi:NAD-dependent deacetylase sirtuin 5
VWFGEALPEGTLNAVDKWIEEGPIDLMLVIGTAAEVWPAASYIEIARSKGARVAVVNIEDGVVGRGRRRMTARDWMFVGDAAVLVPRMLEGVIGELKVPE